MIHDTIIARASAPGGAMRGIIRVSGQDAHVAVKTIIDSPDTLLSDQRPGCVEVRIVLPPLPPFPAKLFLWNAGHSYTGDETVEVHTIGSPVLLDAIMTALLSVSDSIRLANPGEFTLRAFLSGRLDLAQAEAVLGVIDSANDIDLKTALYQLAGNVSAPLSAVRQHLFETLASLEASLDFAEEEIPAVSPEKLRRTLTEALAQIELIRQKISLRGITEGKPKIVLTGLPNVGKSTLFNKLAGREVALVSPLAGTTRDYLEVEIDWEGIDVVLIDTAGIDDRQPFTEPVSEDTDRWKPADELEKSAQTKAREILEQADIVVYCYETALSEPQSEYCGKTLIFQTKTPNENIESLRKEIGTLLRHQPEFGMLPNTALRCRESLIAAEESLRRALTLTDGSLIALEFRNAVNQLGLIDGTIHTEDILGCIFSRFCIGK